MGVLVQAERNVSRVARHGRWLYAAEHAAVVRYDLENPGSVEVVLSDERVFASLAVDAQFVYIARVNAGTIARVAHGGGEPTVLAQPARPLGLGLRDGWLGWLDKPFVDDPVRGPPYSVQQTTVCAMADRGGTVAEYLAGTRDWGLAMAREGMVWVRGGEAGPRIVGLFRHGDDLEVLVDDLGELDESGGFVHVAATDEELIVAVPTRAWMRRGVELRRHELGGRFVERLAFVHGRFNSLDAYAHGIGLIVERGPSIVARFWPSRGEVRSARTLRQPGPLVHAHVCGEGLHFAVGSTIHRV